MNWNELIEIILKKPEDERTKQVEVEHVQAEQVVPLEGVTDKLIVGKPRRIGFQCY